MNQIIATFILLITFCTLSAKDGAKIDELMAQAQEQKAVDTTKALAYIQQAYEICRDSKDPALLATTLRNHGDIYYYHGEYQRAIQLFERAGDQFLLSNDSIALANVMVDEGNAKLFLALYDQALSHYNSAFEIFKSKGDRVGMSRCLNNSGIIYKNFGWYDRALRSYDRVIDIYQEMGDRSAMTDTYSNIGVVQVLLGNYHLALDNFNKALTIARESENLEQQAICLMNSGVIHNKMDHFEKALELYENALKISIALDDKVEISKCLTNIGTNYMSMGKYDLATDFVNRGLEIKLELGDRNSIANCYNFLADIAYHQGRFEEAISMDTRAIKLKKEVADPEGLARVFATLSRNYLSGGSARPALAMADSSLKYSLEIGSLEHSTSAYLYKKEALASLGNYREALKYAELHKNFSDSLQSLEKSRVVSQIEQRYRNDILEMKNQDLVIQSEQHTAKLLRNRQYIVTLMILAILFGTAIMLLIYFQRKLRLQFDQLTQKNQIITRQNLKLDAFNRTKDKILSVITHDLRGTIGNQLTALDLLAKEEFENEEERKVIFRRLANSASLSLSILENLTQWTKIQEGTIIYSPEQGYIDKTIVEVQEFFKASLNNKELRMFNDFKANYPSFYDHSMIQSVLKNLMSNAIKFSHRGGSIIVGIVPEKDAVTVFITDHGTGISNGELDEISSANLTKMRRGTENEKGSGLGYSIIRTYLEMHGSKWNIKSELGSGTTVSFELPAKRPV